MPFDPAAQTPVHLRFTTDPPNFRDMPIAELIVTEQRTSILVHKHLLCDAAPFFHAALTTGFPEATKQQILLPEDDADTVHRFVQWVYFGSYGLPKDHAEQFMQLARSYVFANKVLACLLKNDIIRALFHLQYQDAIPQMPVIALPLNICPSTHRFESY
jgi:hypothetical protein